MALRPQSSEKLFLISYDLRRKTKPIKPFISLMKFSTMALRPQSSEKLFPISFDLRRKTTPIKPFIIFETANRHKKSVVYSDGYGHFGLCLFIKLRTAALRLIVRSWLEVPTFATRRLHTRVTTREHPAAEGATVGEKCPVILPKWQFTRDI